MCEKVKTLFKRVNKVVTSAFPKGLDDEDMSGERGCYFKDGIRKIGKLFTLCCFVNLIQ